MAIDLIGTEILSYRIVKKLGEGGMGAVWRAEHPQLGTSVAIKTLDPVLARDKELVSRFVDEAVTQVRLKHPNIVKVENFTEDPLAMVMEFVEGKDLSAVIGQEVGPIPVARAMPMIRQLLAAVGYAHKQSVVHRDLKPANVLLTENDEIKVMDFGIAKVLGGNGRTRTGASMGTPAYMAPEQIRGAKDADERADIYALGVTIYEMLAGRPPFVASPDSDSSFELMEAQVHQAPPDPRDFYPDIPEAVVDAVFKAMEKSQEDRFQNVDELAEALEKAVSETSVAPAVSRAKAPAVSLAKTPAVSLAKTPAVSLAKTPAVSLAKAPAPSKGLEKEPADTPDLAKMADAVIDAIIPPAPALVPPPAEQSLPATTDLAPPSVPSPSPPTQLQSSGPPVKAVGIAAVVLLGLIGALVMARGGGGEPTTGGGGESTPAVDPQPDPAVDPQPDPEVVHDTTGGASAPTPAPAPVRIAAAVGVARWFKPDNASASSFTRCRGKQERCHPWRALDGDVEFWWQENANGDGIGEYLQVSWSGEREISEVKLVPGLWKTRNDKFGDRWFLNNRLKQVSVVFSSGASVSSSFPDTKGWHHVTINPPQVASWLRIVIKEVYQGFNKKGKHIADSGIAEIRVKGRW